MGCRGIHRISNTVILAVLLLVEAAAAINPAPDDNMLRIVYASEILRDIENGEPVNISSSMISGNLNFGNLSLPSSSSNPSQISSSSLKFINVPIQIVDSEIRGIVNFNSVFFSESCEFTGTIFREDAKFEDVIFVRPAKFRGAHFDKYAYFSNDKFIEGADFGESQFSKTAHFSGTQFCNYAYFRDVLFNGDAQFSGTRFGGDAYFSNAKFDKECYFPGAKFDREVYFKEAQFNFANFEKGQFGEYVGFVKAKFYDDAYFREVQFGGLADFSDTEFREDVYFENAKFDIAFDLSRSKFDRLYVFWDSIDSALVYDGSTYLGLIKNFKNMERFNDADRCYYQYRKISQANKNFGWSKLEDILAGSSCGYGVRPGYTLAWSIACILSFGVIIWAGNGLKIHSNYSYYKKYNTDFSHQNDYPSINNSQNEVSEISLLDSIYYSALVFFHTHLPSSWEPSKRWSLWLVLLEDIIGWLLLALFLVALANVIIR